MQETENIQLNPLMEPSPVPFTFDALGWKILLVLLVLSVIYFSFKYYQFYKKNQYRRDAIHRISEIQLNPENTILEIVKQTMFQLKLTALETFGRNKVASLEGDHWLNFLNESGKDTNFIPYQEVIINAIYQDEYQDKSNFNKEEFSKTSIKWIKSHAR